MVASFRCFFFCLCCQESDTASRRAARVGSTLRSSGVDDFLFVLFACMGKIAAQGDALSGCFCRRNEKFIAPGGCHFVFGPAVVDLSVHRAALESGTDARLPGSPCARANKPNLVRLGKGQGRCCIRLCCLSGHETSREPPLLSKRNYGLEICWRLLLEVSWRV